MHIISASRRTDIPAFHADWFMNRIRAGRVGVGAPFGRGLSEVSLLPEDVITVVFWTKNAASIMPHLDELRERGHCFSFLYTINNYPEVLEPRVPTVHQTMKVVEKLCESSSPGMFRWRYDTVVLTGSLDQTWHLRNFRELCAMLAPYSQTCVFSFCDYYRKTARSMAQAVPDYLEPEHSVCRDLAQKMAEIAGQRDISLACCAHDFLVSGNVVKARCIHSEALLPTVDTQARREALQSLKGSPTRKGCGCESSKDIGAYDTCLHGCVYCYANTSQVRAATNLALIGQDSYSLDPRYSDAAGASEKK
jgi:hypothetical protein